MGVTMAAWRAKSWTRMRPAQLRRMRDLAQEGQARLQRDLAVLDALIAQHELTRDDEAMSRANALRATLRDGDRIIAEYDEHLRLREAQSQ